MSNNNNKQPLDLNESLPISENAQAPSTSTQTVNKLDHVGINLVEMSPVNPREKNVTTRNLSHSDKGSTSAPIIDGITEVNQTPYDPSIGFLLDCAKRGKHRGKKPSPSICKVSRILRDHNESSFEPQLVSIGPIHREDPKLKEFEWLKECYLNDLLSRCDSMPMETILEECLLKVNTLIPQIRESYGGMIENYSDVDLARMMVMDGCFILEFCFKKRKKPVDLPNMVQNNRIAMDLMLLENQVPFVVLQALFDCLAPYVVKEKRSVTLSQVLNRLYLAIFRSLLPKKISTTDGDSDSTHDHVLGYLHKRYQLVFANSLYSHVVSRSIVELDRSGMKFKPHQENVWSMTIKFQSRRFSCLPWFWRKPTLLMPTLVIQDLTEQILRNFIAYEQSFPQGNRYYFTSYAVAMDILINTQEDIAKLVESKVLVNHLGSNQEAADMINKICKNVLFKEFYYIEEFKQMDKYYNGFWPKHIARMRRVYFSNPWSIIALIAAIIMLLATVVSGIFAVLQYFG